MGDPFQKCSKLKILRHHKRIKMLFNSSKYVAETRLKMARIGEILSSILRHYPTVNDKA